VAASLGIAESCLYRWRDRNLVDRGLKPGTTAQESAGLAAAQARIRDLEEEVKILRKAAAAVEAVVRPKDRYRLVAELHAEGERTGRACHALGGIPVGVLRLSWAGALAAGDPPGLAD
jgi:putative transposase